MDAEHHPLPSDMQTDRGYDLVERTEARLAGIDDVPVADHPRVYALVHADLLDALADTDGPGVGAGPA
jgi:hypothetical protein